MTSQRANDDKSVQLEELRGKCATFEERLASMTSEKESLQRSTSQELSGLQEKLEELSKKAGQVRDRQTTSQLS